MAGWPRFSHWPASIDPSEAHSIAVPLSRRARSPVEHLKGQRLSAPRVMDRPRLIGWSSLHLERHRSLTPLVASAGTASPVPEPVGSWSAHVCATCGKRSPAQPRSPLAPLLASQSIRRSRRLRSCRDRPGFPRGRRAALALCSESYARLAHRVSPRSRRCVRQHIVRSPPRPVPGRPLSLPIAESQGTGVRRTNLCLLTSSYEHPRLVGSRCVMRVSACARWGDRLFHVSAIRFGGPHLPRRGIAAGVVFPRRCVRAVPLAPLSPPSRRTPRSRACVTS